MARMRYVKPTFWTDSRMVRLSRDARLFYIGTWNFAICDKGHLEDDPVQLKMQIFPADDIDVEPLMGELLNAGRLVRITDGEVTWLQILKLEPHQKVDGRWTPRCPACKAGENLSETQESLGEAVTSTNAGPEGQNDPEENNLSETLQKTPQEGRGGEGRGGDKPPVVPHDENGEKPEPRKHASRKRPAKPLPDDWQPTAAHVAKARELGVDGRREEEKFRAHAAANDRRQVDWNMAFTQWLLNARPGRHGPTPIANQRARPKPQPRDSPDGPFQYRPARPGEENRLR